MYEKGENEGRKQYKKKKREEALWRAGLAG